MKNILLTLIVFGSFGLSGSLQSKEPTYLSCNCTKAINSLITTGGCWDEKILITLLKKCNINSDNFFEGIANIKIKDQLKNITKEALDKEIFGTPTFTINNKVFWGQDRLEFALDEYNK